MENALVFYEVVLAAGDRRAVIDEYVISDVRVRDDNIELIAHPQ